MQLTQNFKLSEFTSTNTGFSNNPGDKIIENIRFVAKKLQEIRSECGFPIVIDSGYRSARVNQAVNGSPTSLHLQGLAVDIRIDRISYKYMPTFLRLVLLTDPLEIHFNSSRIMHLAWHPQSKLLKQDRFDIF